MTSYLYIFLGSFGLSCALTYLAKKIGFGFGLLSKPRARDVHKNPIPRIGGAAIFLSFLIISGVVFLLLKPDLSFTYSKWLGADKHLAGIWLGAVVITLSMLVDDIFGLKAWQKLSFQILAALIVISSGIGIDYLTNPFGDPLNLNSVYIPIFKLDGIVYHFSLLSDLLTIIWLVGMMNVINFIDGIDGLASGISTIAALTIFFLSLSIGQPAVAMVSLILAGSSMGFLVWNFPPAKIFMGDSGSMFLGFMLGVLPLISGGKLATAFLVLGFPIVDGLIVAGSRMIRGKNPFTTPDKTHIHHRFISAGFSPKFALISIYIVAIAFAWVALRSTTLDKLFASAILVILLFLLILYLRAKAGKIK